MLYFIKGFSEPHFCYFPDFHFGKEVLAWVVPKCYAKDNYIFRNYVKNPYRRSGFLLFSHVIFREWNWFLKLSKCLLKIILCKSATACNSMQWFCFFRVLGIVEFIFSENLSWFKIQKSKNLQFLKPVFLVSIVTVMKSTFLSNSPKLLNTETTKVLMRQNLGVN